MRVIHLRLMYLQVQAPVAMESQTHNARQLTTKKRQRINIARNLFLISRIWTISELNQKKMELRTNTIKSFILI